MHITSKVSRIVRGRAATLAVAIVSIASLSAQGLLVPASAAGGTIDLTVYSDLSACGSMSFTSTQLAIEAVMTSSGGGTTNTGTAAPIAGADYKSSANDSSINLCVPGASNLAGGGATFEFEVQGADQRGAPTVGYATVTCSYTNGLGLQCPPTVRVVIPPSIAG